MSTDPLASSQSTPSSPSSTASPEWADLLEAQRFAEAAFTEWQRQGWLTSKNVADYSAVIAKRRASWSERQNQGQPPLSQSGLPPWSAAESTAAKYYRYWSFVSVDVERCRQWGLLTLAQAHDLIAQVQERQMALLCKISGDERTRVLMESARAIKEPPAAAGADADVALVADAKQPQADAAAPPAPAAPPASHARATAQFPFAEANVPLQRVQPPRVPRRSILEILLDPQNIQWLLIFGGLLMLVGIVILLWINELLTPPVMATCMGVANVLALCGGCWLLLMTRYRMAGRALTLLACLVMPLNLWYYHANDLMTLDGHLWVAALAVCVLYAASAWVLKDKLLVFVLEGGITLTGLLFLADLEPSPQRLLEVALPATLLVVLGVLSILLERAFPPAQASEPHGDSPIAKNPFSREQFGLAFFFSGHAQLAAGLLLVLGAQIAGNWLYEPVFKSMYESYGIKPSPIVTVPELSWLALGLVVAGTSAYVYSDLVVRRIGVYVHLAAATLLWAFVLLLEQLDLALGLDAVILVLAVMGLAVNLVQTQLLTANYAQTRLGELRYTRSLPLLGVLFPMLAVGLGVTVCLRAISPDMRSIWATDLPKSLWPFVGAMAATAISCRAGAFLYRKTHPRLTLTYFFATAAATLVGAAALLAELGLEKWEEHAPLLMLVPIAYLLASRLYRGHSPEMPLRWVAHLATVVMLIASASSLFAGFRLVKEQPLNLALAVFCLEAALFYSLAAALHRQTAFVYAAAVMVCGAIWQLLTYLGVKDEYYTLAFALAGLALLVAYRLGLFERFGSPLLAETTFHSANTLVSLSFVAAALLALSRLATDTKMVEWPFVVLCAVLTFTSLLAVGIVRQRMWRRWYVVTTVGLALLTFLSLQVLVNLTLWQKVEIFLMLVGLTLLVAAHIGWYREQEQHSDAVTVGLLFGALFFAVPPAVASIGYRIRGEINLLDELGFLTSAVLLLTTGYLFRLRSTTLVGAVFTPLYFATLLFLVNWEELNVVAVTITVAGALLFGTGLVLAVYRDRLAQLPQRIKNREGVFRVLNWR